MYKTMINSDGPGNEFHDELKPSFTIKKKESKFIIIADKINYTTTCLES